MSPRKMRAPKLRRDQTNVSAALYTYLLWRDWKAASALQERYAAGSCASFELYSGTGEHAHDVVWRQMEIEATREWADVYPGTRPHSWWLWSAPELRQILGRFTPCSGIARCHPSGMPYGTPADCQDLPMVETQAACLDRLGLWLLGERARVTEEAFDPEPFAYALGLAPIGVPAGHEHSSAA